MTPAVRRLPLQEPLIIGEPEIAFVVGVVCGRAAASALADPAAAAAGVPDGGCGGEAQQDPQLYQVRGGPLLQRRPRAALELLATRQPAR